MTKPGLVITLLPTTAKWVKVDWLVNALARASRAAAGRRLTLQEVVSDTTEAQWRAEIEHYIHTGRLKFATVNGVRVVYLLDLVKWAAFRNVRVEQAAFPGCQSFVEAAYQALHMQLADVSRAPARKAGKLLQQEERILAVLREMGHDPANLPPQKNGTAGVKSIVGKKVCANKELFSGPSTFPGAWARLLTEGRVRYAA